MAAERVLQFDRQDGFFDTSDRKYLNDLGIPYKTKMGPPGPQGYLVVDGGITQEIENMCKPGGNLHGIFKVVDVDFDAPGSYDSYY